MLDRILKLILGIKKFPLLILTKLGGHIMFSKFDAENNFDDLLEIVDSYLEVLDTVKALSDGFQVSDLQAISNLVTGLPASLAGFTDGVAALGNLSPEQHDLIREKILSHSAFEGATEEDIDDITLGAIYFTKVAARRFTQ